MVRTVAALLTEEVGSEMSPTFAEERPAGALHVRLRSILLKEAGCQ
jgi:hypothetical protein